MMDSSQTLLVTHSGTFHLDDAFAYAVLRTALGLGAAGTDHRLVRTRDKTVFAQADIIWDVGGVYDADKGRFDHHQRGAPVRKGGTRLSAAGLVWRRYGEVAVKRLLGAKFTPELGAALAAEIDRDVVHRIDEIDHGEKHPEDTLGLASIVEDCNPTWDAPAYGDQAVEDVAFVHASGLLETFLRHRVAALRARLAARSVVLEAHRRSADPRILELDRKLPWQDAVFEHQLEQVVFAVYPVPNGNWMVDAMPPERGSYAQRLPLPLAWAGLMDATLAETSGIPDAVFVHRERFVGAARSRAGARALAHLAIVQAG